MLGEARVPPDVGEKEGQQLGLVTGRGCGVLAALKDAF
jgi:hypothetical protein